MRAVLDAAYADFAQRQDELLELWNGGVQGNPRLDELARRLADLTLAEVSLRTLTKEDG